MSIVTKTGDQGSTGLMYNRRVSKCHPQVEAYGTVDELNAALGFARATAPDESARGMILGVQKQLVVVMGELATAGEDVERYRKDGYARLSSEHIAEVERMISRLETEGLRFEGWAMPGDSSFSAALDFARTVCRRAERRVCALAEAGEPRNPEIVVYLNRLSDLCWLLARWGDQKSR